MKTTHPFNYRAIVLGLVPVALANMGAFAMATAQEYPLSARIIQDRDYPSRSNTEAGRRMLANAPPAVSGHRQFMGFTLAVLEGKSKPLPFSPPVPENVSAHPDLTYLTIGKKS